MSGVAVCSKCNELAIRPKKSKGGGDVCPKCRGKLDRSLAAFEAWEKRRLERRIEAWHRDGKIDDEVRAKLLAPSPFPPASSPEAEASQNAADGDGAKLTDRLAIEQRADDLFASTSTFFAQIKTNFTTVVERIEKDAPPPSSGSVLETAAEKEARIERSGEAVEAGRVVFGASGAVVGSGIDALSELDDHDGDPRPALPAQPMGALQVFWFIGAVLVLAGSLMGVREAWRSLEGVLRPLVIAGALFAYHVAFVALARMLARRSETTGRVLGVIAMGLAPIAFIAVAVAAGMSRSVGIGSAVLLLGATAATSLAAGRVYRAGVGSGIAAGLLPCLALEVPLGGQESSLARVLVPLVALTPLAIGAVRARVAKVPSGHILAALAASAYGALVVAVYALAGGPSQDALDPSSLGAPLLACVAWVGLASAIGWFAMSEGAIANMLPRAAPVLRVILLSILISAALTGSVAGLSGSRQVLLDQGLLAFTPALIAAIATTALLLESRRHVLALHFAIPLAHFAVLLAAYALPDRVWGRAASAPYWAASMALVPAAILLTSSLGPPRSKGRRIGLGIWAIASSLIVTFVTLGLEPAGNTAPNGTSAPFVITTTVAALLAVAAHAGGRTTRPTQHYLGVVMATIGACAWLMPSRPESAWFTFTMVLDGVAVVYGVLALVYAVIASMTKDEATAMRPFDDASLIAATVCVYFGWAVLGGTPGAIALSRGLEGDAMGALLPTGIAAIVLAGRSVRDRSRLVTFHAGLGLGVSIQLAALAFANGTSLGALAQMSLRATRSSFASSALLAATSTANIAAQSTLVAGLTALLLIVPAMFRTNPSAPAPAAAQDGAKDDPRFGRPLFGIVPLPLGASGRTVLDGFGLAAIVFAALGCARAAQWISAGTYLSPQRDLVVLGLAAIIAGVLASFLSRALAYVRARGHVATLALGGGVIGIAAVAYRIGRPLPPDVVGWRLTLVLFGVWLLARLIAWKGPWLAQRLERPSHGTLYHFVPHAGVLALGALLLVDAFLVGAPTWTRALAVTPPMLLAGGALAMLLLYRSFGARAFLHLGLASLLFFACFVASQQHVLGPTLEPLDPPGGRWMLPSSIAIVRSVEQAQQTGTFGMTTFLSGAWLDPSVYLPSGLTTLRLANRAIIGSAVFVAACAALLALTTRVPQVMHVLARVLLGRRGDEADEDIDREGHVEQALLAWTVGGSCIAAVAIAWQPSIVAGAILIAAAVVALAARSHPARALAIAALAPMMIHALAHGEATAWALNAGTMATFLTASMTLSPALLPMWGGPALAALTLAVVAAGIKLARGSGKEGRDPAVLVASQGVSLLYAFFAFEYAMASLGTMQATAAFWRVSDLSQLAMDGRFAQTYSVAITLGLLAIASAVAAWSWRGAIARVLSVIPPLVLGAAAAAFSATFAFTTNADVFTRTITRDGALVGATLAASAAVVHVTSIVLQTRQRDDVAWGSRIGRDALLGGSALVMAIFVTNSEPGGRDVATLGMVALGLPIAISVHAITRESSSRHVYFVEVMVVALYAFATRALNLRPEIDAMLGLGYGFTLLGVAVVARRQGIMPVADATRRFLGALPFLVAFLTMRGPVTNTAAMFAVGASVLYGVVAVTEHSRAFGSLAAVAANIALVVFALAQGLDGVEIWLGPLGLLVAAISQIFAPKLNHAARSAIRITGGALLYLPSGLKLALRLGAAEDATYSVVFGAVCLLGVVIGVVLKVRAYLALATFSLTLDVIANLVYAGLRDHRLGFVILSASGLLILGVMIMVTLRRESARAFVGNVRTQLSGWD